jgi:hypothetical protein
MTTMTMTAAQTAIYDGGDDAARDAMMRALRDSARTLAATTGRTVEVCTDDGAVVTVVSP